MSKKGYNPPPLDVQLPIPPPSLPPKHLADAEARIEALETALAAVLAANEETCEHDEGLERARARERQFCDWVSGQ